MEQSDRQFFLLESRESPSVMGRRTPTLPGARRQMVIFAITFVVLTSAAHSADDPASVLKRTFETAKTALAAGDLQQAESRYDEVITLGLRQLANLSASESRFEEAARELDEALVFTPADVDTTTDAAIAWFRAGDVNKARELVAALLVTDPRQARAQNVLGRIDLYRGDFEPAIHELKASIILSDDFESSYFLGIAYLKAQRSTDAQQWFQHLQSKMGNSSALHVLIGRAYSIAHFPEPAVAEFRKAIQLNPGYPHAHGLLGYSILELRGEEAYPQARVEFEKELKIHPDDYNALVLLGISAVALRDFAAAETALLHARRLRPNEALAFLYLGEVFSETKHIPQAVEALEKYIRLVHDPEEVPRDISRAYYLLGQALRRLGRQDQAQAALLNSQRYREAKFRYDTQHIFDELGTASDGDSHSSNRIEGILESGAPEEQKTARAIIQGGVPESTFGGASTQPAEIPETKAAKEYRSLVQELLASSYNDLGVMRAKASQFTEAAKLFKQAAAWKPSLAGLDRNWGLASYHAQLYSQAIRPLERQLAASPQDALVRELLGLSYFMTNKFDETAEVLRPFLNNPPDDAGLLLAWGTSLVRARQLETAAKVFRRLLEQNANDPKVHLLLGQAYAQQRDYTNALAEFHSAVLLDPSLPEAHYYSGLVHLRQGNFESAANEFRFELEIRPDDPVAGYHLGYALLLQGQAAAAATILSKVVEAKPDYEVAQFELGRALLQFGDARGAIERFEAAKMLFPDRDATYFQLSQAYRRVGRLPEAEQALATYQKLIETNRLKRRESLEANDP